ncbi:MAG: hypothetical protein BGO30_02810 [Bacteroidetes bacterium 41-46]|nr:MAG: hypothetical protein BGO30_02810 [Bacteroidetes bacterium 41-46]
MRVKQAFINSVWFGVIPRITTIINLFILPFITPYLTPFDYGIIGIINSYSGIFIVIATLGLNIHLTNSFYIYKNHFRKVWGRILVLLIISGVIFGIIYGIIMYFSLIQVNGKLKFLTAVCACLPIILNGNTTLAKHYYPLIYKPRPLVIINLISGICGIFITFILIYFFKMGFLGWIIGSSASAIVAFIAFSYQLWYQEKIIPIFFYDFNRIKKWLTISLPIIPHTLGFVLISSSARIIMDWLNISINDIGIYTNGYIMGDYITVITTALIISIAPRIQELYRERNFIKLKTLFFFCQIIALLSSLTFAIWMPEIYELLIRNADLQPASKIAIFISFANAAFPFYTFISTIAFIEEKTTKILWLVFIPASLNIILNFVFLPLFNYKVAIYVALISYWSQLAIPFIVPYFREITKALLGNLKILIYLFMTMAILTILGYLFSKTYISIKILITIIIISFVFFISLKNKEI